MRKIFPRDDQLVKSGFQRTYDGVEGRSNAQGEMAVYDLASLPQNNGEDLHRTAAERGRTTVQKKNSALGIVRSFSMTIG